MAHDRNDLAGLLQPSTVAVEVEGVTVHLKAPTEAVAAPVRQKLMTAQISTKEGSKDGSGEFLIIIAEMIQVALDYDGPVTLDEAAALFRRAGGIKAVSGAHPLVAETFGLFGLELTTAGDDGDDGKKPEDLSG